MNELESLRPRLQLHVMDLVRDAGIDVTDWVNFKGGARKAKSNPKYCYNWTFTNPTVVVLNLWYDQIFEQFDKILVTDNMRLTSKSISTKVIWRKRAEQFDTSIKFAYKNRLIVRVIINQGNRRLGNSKSTEASKVSFRMLDSKPWTVTSYDDTSGEFLLTREAPIFRMIDQFTSGQYGQNALGAKYFVNSEVFVRSPIVRQLVLIRANGKCEYCGQNGFITNNGSLFLETHHIEPLSENGADNIYNVAALCPNHHREAHHGANAKIIKSALVKRLNNKNPTPN